VNVLWDDRLAIATQGAGPWASLQNRTSAARELGTGGLQIDRRRMSLAVPNDAGPGSASRRMGWAKGS